MSRRGSYTSWPLRALAVLVLLLTQVACEAQKTKKLNRRLSFSRKDKIPYGTYIAYENLSHLFPNAEISVSDAPFASLLTGGNKKVYIAVVHRADPDPAEINNILSFVGAGNHVLISSLYFGDSLLHKLGLRAGPGNGLNYYSDSMRVSVNDLAGDSSTFAYPGAAYDNWWSTLDSQYTSILGRDEKGRPNFVRLSYKGGGTLLLHLAPTAFTNFFLLHKHNMGYYDAVLSYLPGSAKEVIWDESYINDRSSFSALGFIWRNKPLRVGLLLLLFLLTLLYLFDSKRKQRIVPVIQPLRNTTLDFVKTIGRLYYQRRDNHNLVMKIGAHFQDHIRNRYNLVFSPGDPGFPERLAHRTGLGKEFIYQLLGDLSRMQDSPGVTDGDLLHLNGKMEEFYKHA